MKSRPYFKTLIFSAAALLSSCTSKAPKDLTNTLFIPVQEKVKTLDPVLGDDLYSGDEISKVYEGLLHYHYLKRPLTLAPSLAETLPTVSKDRRTYTFKIKKGVLFQDDPCFKDTQGRGRELTAQDFVYSWKRLADSKNVSPGWWVLDGHIVGLNEWRDSVKTGSPDYSKPVEGLKAVDRYTLEIKLTKPSNEFLYGLAMGFTAVVPQEAVEAYGREFINHPVGTGPFRLEEFNGASRIVWVRNPTYRKELYPSDGESSDKANGLLEDAGKQIPFLNRIVVQIFVEQQPMWLNFMAKKIDLSWIPKDSFDQAVGPDRKLKPELVAEKISMQIYSRFDTVFTAFNMNDPVVGKSKALRQALSLSYDNQKHIDLFYNGFAIPAQGPVPPDLAGYLPGLKSPYVSHDLTRAKALLAQAGFPGGKGLPELEYGTVGDSTSRQMTEFMQQRFQDIGVKLKINTYSWPQFQAASKTGKLQMWSQAWGADYPDAENFLQLFYGKNVSPGPNDWNYSNPEYDRLYEQMLTFAPGPERNAVIAKMTALLDEDCPWIFHAHRTGKVLSHPWVKNLKYSEVAKGYYKYLRVIAH